MQGKKRAAEPRQRNALFQLGDYWLDREPGRTNIYRYWYDAGARKTRRKATEFADLEKAKAWLAAEILKEAPSIPENDPGRVTIAAVRAFYWEHHGRHIRSGNVALQAFNLVDEFFDKQPVDGAPKVRDFEIEHQILFMKWCAAAKGLKAKSISTYLLYIKAALRFCARPHMITDGRGGHRKAHLLASAPFVECAEKVVAKTTGQTMSKPRDFVPTDVDLARVLDEIGEPSTRRYCIMALNTWARPEAITELRVSKQVDFERGLVHLNAPGRAQNNKVRPTIRLSFNLRAWLIYWNADAPICKWTKDGRNIIVKRVDNRTLKDAAIRAGVPDAERYNRYVFRHYMATRVRRASIEVPREQRSEWLGHVDPDHRTTERWYESMDEDHLLEAARATDEIVERLDGLMRRWRLVAPAVQAGTRLMIVENDQKSERQA